MTGNEYQKLTRLTRFSEDKEKMLINGVMGLCGETGEVVDIIKKYLFHNKPLLGADDLMLELGDVLWYIAEIADVFGYNFDTLFEKNIEKLKKRYPNGFPEKNI